MAGKQTISHPHCGLPIIVAISLLVVCSHAVLPERSLQVGADILLSTISGALPAQTSLNLEVSDYAYMHPDEDESVCVLQLRRCAV